MAVLLSQFVMILLLGLQSLNVNQRRYLAAAITSLLLGVIGFYLTGTVAEAHKDGAFTLTWWAYISGGPAGIVASMWLHQLLFERKKSSG